MRHDFHIIIVGGGMVGACAAALAAADPHLAGLRIAVLEANPPTAPAQSDIDLRVSAVSRASQRILASVGAWPLVPPQSLSPYEEMIVWDAAGNLLRRRDLAQLALARRVGPGTHRPRLLGGLGHFLGVGLGRLAAKR